MTSSTLLTLLVIVLPLATAIGAYVLLRRQDRSFAASGCAALALGVLISFAMTLAFFAAGWA